MDDGPTGSESRRRKRKKVIRGMECIPSWCKFVVVQVKVHTYQRQREGKEKKSGYRCSLVVQVKLEQCGFELYPPKALLQCDISGSQSC